MSVLGQLISLFVLTKGSYLYRPMLFSKVMREGPLLLFSFPVYMFRFRLLSLSNIVIIYLFHFSICIHLTLRLVAICQPEWLIVWLIGRNVINARRRRKILAMWSVKPIVATVMPKQAWTHSEFFSYIYPHTALHSAPRRSKFWPSFRANKNNRSHCINLYSLGL